MPVFDLFNKTFFAFLKIIDVLFAFCHSHGTFMAHQLLVKKPKVLLFDVVSTVTKTSFIDKVLLPYVSSHIKQFLEENWDSKSVQADIDNLRWQAKQEPGAPQIPINAERDALIDATMAFVKYCVDKNNESQAIILLRLHMWFDGYKRDRLETPVYSDSACKLKKWHFEQNIKLYVLSNGWNQASKRFLSRTNHGDLNELIMDHFDTEMGLLTDESTYRKVLEQINEPPEVVLFLTKDAAEGQAALRAGLSVVLVMTHRRNIEKLDEDAKKMPRVRSFNDIEFANEN